jgi:AraC-like DNA-binding protein
MAEDAAADQEAQVLLTDIRMDGVSFSSACLKPPFCAAGLSGPVSLCYVVRGGPLWLETDTGRRAIVALAAGSVVGLSGFVDHWFKSAPETPVIGAKTLAIRPLSEPRDADAPLELLVGHAPMEALALTNTVSGVLIIPPNSGRVSRRIERAVEGIEDELRDSDPMPGSAAVVRRLSETILMNIARWAASQSTQAQASALNALTDLRVMRALAAAARSPLDAWTVSRMAAIAGMSRTAFAARFNAVTGDTPLHMLSRLRLRSAAEALTTGTANLDEVAALAGYGSAAAFVRAFRRAYDTTPARWRASHNHGAAHASTEGGWTIDQ